MALTDAELLRIYLGEPIPAGGSDADTLFTDDDITAFLEEGGGVEAGAAIGWRAKAANLAELVDVTEGPSKRALQQRYANAKDMATFFGQYLVSPGGGRTKIKEISREGSL